MKKKLSFLFFFSSRPGRPPKRNSAHQIDDCLDDKRMKLSSSLLLRSFPDFANQGRIKKKEVFLKKTIIFIKIAFKYPVHSNGYLSVPTANGNQSSSFIHSFGHSAFAPTLPIHFAHNHHHHHHHPYLLGENRAANYKTSIVPPPSTSSSSSSSHRAQSSSK